MTTPGGRTAFIAWTPSSGTAAMMRTLRVFLPEQPDTGPPPFLRDDPNTVRDRFGGRISDVEFETAVVRYPALSPAHFWESMTTDSGAIMLAVEEVAKDEHSSLWNQEIDALTPYFSDAQNAMELEYLLVTATVA